MLINGYQVNGVKLRCEYKSGGWGNGISGYCQFLNDGTFNGLRVKIDSVEMTNAGSVSTNDVKALHIYQMPSLNYFPENLAAHFKNILGISVSSSNLQEISSNDLKDFTKLQYLYIYDSKITTIEEGLFSNNPELKFIYLVNNQISHIDPHVFDNLRNLNELYLSSNKCKQSFGAATSRSEVLKFIERIKKGECSDEQIMQKQKEAQEQLMKAKQQAEETKLQESNNNQMQILRDQLSATNVKIQELQDKLIKAENDLKTKTTELQDQLNASKSKIQELQDKHSTWEKSVDECNNEKESCLQRMNEVQSTCLANQQPVNEFKKEIAVLSDFLNTKFSDIEKLIKKMDEIQKKDSNDGDQCLTVIVGPNQDTIILSN